MKSSGIEPVVMMLFLIAGAVLAEWVFRRQLMRVIMARKRGIIGIIYEPQVRYTPLLRVQWTLLLMCCFSLPFRFITLLGSGISSLAGAVAAVSCLFAFVFNLVTAVLHRPRDYRPTLGAIAIGVLHGLIAPSN